MKPEGRVADGGGHASNLAIFPLREFEGKPAVGHVFAKPHGRITRWQFRVSREGAHPTRSSVFTAKCDARTQLGEGICRRNAFDENPVTSAVTFGGVEQTVIEFGLVAEEK
jgi:hypothetical protein